MEYGIKMPQVFLNVMSVLQVFHPLLFLIKNVLVEFLQSIYYEVDVISMIFYVVKVNNRNTRTRCEICFKSCSSVSIVNFEHVIATWAMLLIANYQ